MLFCARSFIPAPPNPETLKPDPPPKTLNGQSQHQGVPFTAPHALRTSNYATPPSAFACCCAMLCRAEGGEATCHSLVLRTSFRRWGVGGAGWGVLPVCCVYTGGAGRTDGAATTQQW